MARASIQTLLPLDTFAKVMGVNPVHFNGGTANDSGLDGTGIMTLTPNSCDSVWWQHTWQNSKTGSRETIARQVSIAETEIAQILGYLPAPNWIVEDFQFFPQPYDHEWYGRGWDVRWQRTGVKLGSGKLIAGGRRATSLIGTATVAGLTLTYSDDDGDLFYETATIVLPTSVTDVNEIKVYFAGESADEIWEVRPVRSKTISGGSVTIVLDSWLLTDPDLWEQYPPGAGLGAINMSTTDNFVTSIEVWRVYNDTTQASAVFYWRDPCNLCNGSGCAACQESTQNGCFTIIDAANGVVAPWAANYDSDNSQWVKTAWTESRAPDRVAFYYYAGERSERFLKGKDLEPMPWQLAQAISYMATARILGGFCACVNVSALVEWLQEDVSRLTQGASYFTPQEILLNPFGTRRGEVVAYKTCRAPQKRLAKMALV